VADTALLWDTAAAVLLIAGASLSMIAGVGLTVLPDLLTRIHAAAKPQVLGLLLMLAGLAVVWRAWVWLPILFFAWLLQMVTAPVAAHLVARAGYRTKHVKRELLDKDELAEVVRRGRHRERGPDTAEQPTVPEAEPPARD
jgi:multicomponent Na+:H+ antiporter subunit G